MIYLKADDEATFTAALKTAGWAWDTEYQLDEDGNRVQVESEDVVLREAGIEAYSHTHSLDIIGVIHVETGETITVEATDDMEEHTYPETAPIDGWHSNLLLHGEELPDALSGFVIEAPTAPVRRFA
jgi:hypothetical protein